MICDWCGHDHDVTVLCTQRPRARGVTRRSFVALCGVGVAGLALAPQMPLVVHHLVQPPDLDAFGKFVARYWWEKFQIEPHGPGIWRVVPVPRE